MNRFFNFFIGGLLAVATLAAPLKSATAQSAPEPAVVISLASISQHLATTDYLMEAAGYAELKFFTQTMVKQYTKGLDTKTPGGVMLFFNGDSEIPDFLGFVPVKNIDDMLDTISNMAEVDEGDDFITIVTDDGTEFMIKQVGTMAFISNKAEMFENLPEDPAAALGELPTKYNVAAQVFGQRVPQSLRDQAIDTIRDGYEQQMELLAESEPLQAELQRENFDYSMKQFEMYLNETDSFTIGMMADKVTNNLFMDFEIVALPGSEMAQRILGSKSTEPSLMKGFLMESAAFTHNARINVTEADAADYKKAMDQVKKVAATAIDEESDLSEEDAEVVNKAIGDLLEVLQETVAAGTLDSGAVLMLKDADINFAAGVQVADPKKLEATVKDLVAMAEEKLDGELQVELNSGSHKDVTFHRLVLEVPDDEEEVRDILGDQLTVIVGIGSKTAYLGAGTDPLPLMKQAMDGKGPSSDTPMMQYNVFVTPILKFAANIEGNPILEKMAAELESNGKDQIRMTSKLIDNGMSMRFEMQDGILALIKVGVENMGGGGFNDNDF